MFEQTISIFLWNCIENSFIQTFKMWLWNILTKVIFFLNDLLSFSYSHGSFDETFHEPHRHKFTMKTGNGVTKLSMELSHMPPVKSLSHTHKHMHKYTWFPKPLTPSLGWGIWKTSALPCQSGQLEAQTKERQTDVFVVFPRHPAHWPIPSTSSNLFIRQSYAMVRKSISS